MRSHQQEFKMNQILNRASSMSYQAYEEAVRKQLNSKPGKTKVRHRCRKVRVVG